MKRYIVNKNEVQSTKALEGVYRKTLIYNDDMMLCLFILQKGAEIPIHSHKETQIGYIIKGKLKFYTSNYEFTAKEGDSYVFNSNEKHGASVLEDTEVIDVFNPSRDDYK